MESQKWRAWGGGLDQILYGVDLDFPLLPWGSAGEGFSHLGWGGMSTFPALWSIRRSPPEGGDRSILTVETFFYRCGVDLSDRTASRQI